MLMRWHIIEKEIKRDKVVKEKFLTHSVRQKLWVVECYWK